MYRNIHPTIVYTLFSSAYGTFTNIDLMVELKASLNKFQKWNNKVCSMLTMELI